MGRGAKFAVICISFEFKRNEMSLNFTFRTFFIEHCHWRLTFADWQSPNIFTIPVYPYQSLWQYPDGDPPTGASNNNNNNIYRALYILEGYRNAECKWGMKNRYFRSSGFITCCQRCDRLGVINTVPPPWQVVTLIVGSSKRRSLLMVETTTKCLWQEALRRRQQNDGI